MSAINYPELAHFETVFKSSHFLKHHDDEEKDPVLGIPFEVTDDIISSMVVQAFGPATEWLFVGH